MDDDNDNDGDDDKTSTDTCGVTGPTLSALCIVSHTILILPTFHPPLTEEDMNGCLISQGLHTITEP